MNTHMLIQWLITTLAVAITSYLLPGVVVAGFFAALITALVIGLINIFVKPFIIFFTLPLTILTFGLFTFIINALLIQLASFIVPGFSVINFGWALLFSIVLAIVNFFLKALTDE